ncbi:neuroendocrine convertase 1-like isoform X1 [Diorhabda sublineata]|uniref:neuroendocrine convertase 1-like isoform X1 n=1 Tax=Diorhabda sublineata TaxID=1163346 RepID=UPI0024E15FFB|nr:neuroendocrine convertase 1-like isoform X1 [Diorhabda sublineata]
MKVYILILLNLNYIVRGYNEVVVRIIGGPLIAQLLAEEHGHYYKGPVMGFEDTYILIPMENVYESYQKRGHYTKKLFSDHRVVWVEEQVTKSRQKRDFLAPEDVPKERVKRLEDVFTSDRIFNDELWTQQWYLRNTRSQLSYPHLDLNVLPVYDIGLTGKGVRILILDDGIEYTHDDLIENYDSEISWDCNEDDNDPFPRMDESKSNNHGTRCAGEIAMSANNRKCGVGIAFGAKIGGIKMLDGSISDRIEGTALGYARHLVDIYSASWGPNDDGKTLDGPGRLAAEAIERGINEGRGGKGAIYVWASGNGGKNNDNCNCDGYLASPYTISIGSVSQKGEFPWYGEACASTLAVTYSSGAYRDQMIATTDVNNACTTKHTGTSASAPLAAGIIALALEANGNLTWRDIQHLIVWTSDIIPLINNDGWQRNSAGFWFNDRFGFGVMNAFNLISNAITWKTVPERTLCYMEIPVNSTLSPNRSLKIVKYSDGCIGTDHQVNYLEHVELRTNINYTCRGALQIQIISPSGTTVDMLTPRKLDKSEQGLKNWTFMSVMTWGEAAEGTWIIFVKDTTSYKRNYGVVGNMHLILHGTKTLPNHMQKGPRDYNIKNTNFEDMLINSVY